MRTVLLAFYTGLGTSEPWINRATAWCTGKYMHVELVFATPGTVAADGGNMGGRVVEACGVWQGETVFLRPKRFGKTCWEWRALSLPPATVDAVYRFCQAQARAQRPFNKSGLYRSLTPCPRPTDGTQWFCSELVVSALQAGGMLLDAVAAASTPTSVYRAIDGLDEAYHAGTPLLQTRLQHHPLKHTLWRRRLGGGGGGVGGAGQ